MKSLADISQTKRPKGQRIAVSSRKKVSLRNQKKGFIKSMESIRDFVLSITDDCERGEVLHANSPIGWSLVLSSENKLFLVRWLNGLSGGELEGKDALLEFLEQTFKDSNNTSVFGKIYVYELAFELQKKLRAILFKLTPPFPQDKYAHFTGTLFHAHAMLEGSLFLCPRPPNSWIFSG